MQGWVKIHRKFLEWGWYNDSEAVHLFIHLLLKANHKEKNWKDKLVKKGSFITSLKSLNNETGISNQRIRTILKRLENTNEITVKSTNKYRVISIVKYKDYQVEDNKITNNKQTTNKQLTTTKNDNKEINIYREFDHLKISKEQYEKLSLEYGEKNTNDILDSIENYSGNKNYKSLYLTAKNWLKRLHKEDKDDKLLAKAKKLGYVK